MIPMTTIHPSRKVMAVWLTCLLAVAHMTTHQAAAQVDPTAVASEGPIQLYLFAEYTPGLAVPAKPPQLQARAINSKRISCSHRRAATISGAANGDAAATVLESAARRAKCVSAYPLNGGLYTLLASYIEGANWATWKCYKNTPAAQDGVGIAAAASAEVPLFSAQAVQLDAGSSYSCVATYAPLTAEQKAAIAALDWNQEVVTAASVADNYADISAATAAASAAAAPTDTTDNTSVEPAVGASCRQPAYTQPPRGQPAPPLDAQGAKIVNALTREPVAIRGINWFGFNVPMGMVDGLWAGGSDGTTDFSTIAYELKMLGYNAVRLPFVHQFLAKTEVWDLQRDCTHLTPSQLRQRLTDPNDQAASANKALPNNVSPMLNPAGKCNMYLPTTNNKDRLMFVLQQFVALGFYVVLDYQPMGLEQQAYNLNQFVSAWSDVWKQVTCLPNFYADIAGRVLIDVMNEPDSMGIRWEASGDRPGAEQLYLATADALNRITPGKMLFMFEGTGQNNFGLNWGNGFITDQQVISSRGLSNPISFFNQLVTRPWVNKVVFSPHLYPPSITMSVWLGQDLWKQSQTAFAYLQSPGYCSGGKCNVFPILVGETGSAYKEANDKTWLQDFSDFIFARGQAAQFNKVPVNGWMWWAYNENSGDTGGIVMNQWQDWDWDKLRFMKSKLDLAHWYLQPSGVSKRRPRKPTSDDAYSGVEAATAGGIAEDTQAQG